MPRGEQSNAPDGELCLVGEAGLGPASLTTLYRIQARPNEDDFRAA